MKFIFRNFHQEIKLTEEIQSILEAKKTLDRALVDAAWKAAGNQFRMIVVYLGKVLGFSWGKEFDKRGMINLWNRPPSVLEAEYGEAPYIEFQYPDIITFQQRYKHIDIMLYRNLCSSKTILEVIMLDKTFKAMSRVEVTTEPSVKVFCSPYPKKYPEWMKEVCESKKADWTPEYIKEWDTLWNILGIQVKSENVPYSPKISKEENNE